MSRLKAFYHSRDLDGWACGALIKIKFPKANMIPIDYGEEFPRHLINKFDVVGFFDWFPNDFDIVEEVFSKATMLWIVDHHVSTRKEISKHNLDQRIEYPSEFITDSDEHQEAACELMYKWLHKTEKIPYYLKLLGRYDVWDHSDPNTLPFQYAARAWLDDPRKDLQKWKKLIYTTRSTDEDYMKGLVEKGKLVMEYERKQAEKEAQRFCFETEIDGYKAIAINRPYTGSKFFDSVYDPKKHDLMLSYAWDGKKYNLSFYSTTIDVSEIALKYLGGGHSGSAGSQVSEIPFKIKGE